MTGADAIAIIILLTILIAVGVYLLHWLYRHSSKDEAFVRTGFGGEKVVMGGGAFVVPIIHDITLVNMNTVPLELKRAGESSLIVKLRQPQARTLTVRSGRPISSPSPNLLPNPRGATAWVGGAHRERRSVRATHPARAKSFRTRPVKSCVVADARSK